MVLKHTASKEHMQEGLRTKTDKADMAREISTLKSLINTKHDLGPISLRCYVSIQTHISLSCIGCLSSDSWFSRKRYMTKHVLSCAVFKELLTKADTKLLDKKSNWDAVVSALSAQEEALKGVSTAFSQSLTEVIQGLQRLENDVCDKAPKNDTECKLEVSEKRERARARARE